MMKLFSTLSPEVMMSKLMANLLAFCATCSLNADGAMTSGDEISPQAIKPCARCVEAREYNRLHPNQYFNSFLRIFILHLQRSSSRFSQISSKNKKSEIHWG